jgi:dTMP kinase
VGRSTHVELLKASLERSGHAVLDTGMARSELAGKGLRSAKDGHTLGGIAMSLFYATDFADRLERDIMPALRAGLVVLADRYIYSLMARATVRGADIDWLRGVYEFTPKPDAIVYLRTTVDDLATRVARGSGFTYWESGMDLRLGEDLYDSFIAYQTRLQGELDRMAGEYAFTVVDAAASIQTVSEQVQRVIEPRLPACATPPARRLLMING